MRMNKFLSISFTALRLFVILSEVKNPAFPKAPGN